MMTTFSDALLLSAVCTALMCLFLPARRGMTLRRAALFILIGAALQVPAHMIFCREKLASYLYALALWSALYVLARLWSGDARGACAQRALCLFLLLDCLMLSVSHVTWMNWGFDPFRSSPLTIRLLFLALLFPITLALLTLLKRMLPKTPCADGNSLWMSFLAVVPYLFMSQITIWLPIDSSQITLAVPAMVCACCLIALLMIVSLEGRLSEEKERRQMLAQHHVMQLQQRQYEMSKNSQEAVRRNYHDMKNLLLYLEQADSREEVREHIQHILSDIRPYESLLNTGSEVMDVLLGEKLAACQQEGIACTVMADGAALAFIKPLDLVAMLGNAMDNAIEACMHLPKDSARYIQVRTARRQGFILLLVRNSCKGGSSVQDGHFVTTKEDSENHGYGLSSIRRAVQGYGGEMTCRMEDGEFSLTLLFPV